MSILFVEGFDNEGASDGATYGKWVDAVTGHSSGWNGQESRSLVNGRFGAGTGKALQLGAGSDGFGDHSWSYNDYTLPADKQTLFSSFGLLTTGVSTSLPFFWFFDNLSAVQIDLRLDIGSHILVTRNGTTLCTASTALSTSTWFWVELGFFISSSAGWVELKLNGNLVASYYGLNGTSRVTSNGNTQASSISSVRSIRHGINSGINNTSGNCTFDDMVFNDNAGSVNNDFIGEVRVIGVLPNANGTNSNFARTGGTASGNYTAVNENPIDGDTSYVSASTVSLEDTYKYPSLPTGTSTVIAVVSEMVAKKDDAGSRSITARVRSGGSEADAPTTISLGSLYSTQEQVMEVNPVTGLAWTVNDVNAVEIGPHITA